MPNKKKIDFLKAKEDETILQGLVQKCHKDIVDGKEVSSLTIVCMGHPVIIMEEDVVNFPFAKTLRSLVGEEIMFMVKDVFPETGTVYGTMKAAYKKKHQPVYDMLHKGEALEGRVVYTTPNGAYISIGGVQGFMKNYDFSDNGTEIKDVYPKGSLIKVKFSRYSKNGNLILQPEEKLHGEETLDPTKIKKGDIYYGKITGTYPDRVYVNIMPGVDCMCHIPSSNSDPKINDYVQVKISKSFIGDDKKLYVRGELTTRVLTNRGGLI